MPIRATRCVKRTDRQRNEPTFWPAFLMPCCLSLERVILFFFQLKKWNFSHSFMAWKAGKHFVIDLVVAQRGLLCWGGIAVWLMVVRLIYDSGAGEVVQRNMWWWRGEYRNLTSTSSKRPTSMRLRKYPDQLTRTTWQKPKIKIK